MPGPNKSQKCWECRERRLVCDLTSPTCKKCAARGVTCPGYGARPLKWRCHHPALSTRSRDNTGRGAGQGPRCESMEVVPRSVKLNDSIRTAHDAVQYYNRFIAPELHAAGDTDARSPYLISLAAIPYLPESIIASIACASLGHRIIQLGDTSQEEQIALTIRLRTHRGAALRSITDHLGNPREQTRDSALLAIILFLMVELANSPSSDGWRRHCDAAFSIIDLRGGMSSILSSRPSLSRPDSRYLLAYLFIIDVVGCTTAPEVERERALRQLNTLALLPRLYGNGLETVFLCPPELFADIVRINVLRSDTSLGGAERLDTAALILQHVLAFSPEGWATTILSASQDHENHWKRKNGASEPADHVTVPYVQGKLTDWTLVVRIYQQAIAIYCLESSGFGARTYCTDDTTTATIGLRRELTDRLVRDLKTVASGSTSLGSQLRKVVIWPLVIAGIKVPEHDDGSRSFILKELKWISHAFGTYSTAGAAMFLEGLWARKLVRGGWDELFDKPYIFAM